MIRSVNIYPNPQLLKIADECKPVEDSLDLEVDTSQIWPTDLIEFVNDLKDTLANSKGIGLAANQIWDKDTNPPRVFAMKIGDEIIEVINPELKLTGKPVDIEEGCLSRPGLFKKMRRKQTVNITYQTLKSRERFSATFYYSSHKIVPIVIQHEVDHLNGKVI